MTAGSKRLMHPALTACAGIALVLLTACGSPADKPVTPAGPKPPETCEDLRRLNIPAREFPVPTHSADAALHFSARLEQFAASPLEPGQIVMLGDSLTELNDWSGLKPAGHKLQNRGISGDTSDGLLIRLGEAAESRPAAVFVLIGTNDLWTDNTPLITACNIRAISDELLAGSPDTKVFVQTVFPQNWAPDSNKRVRSVNALLKQESQRAGFVLVDTYAVMVDRRGRLKADYTNDGLHLNDAGNAAWEELVGKTIEASSLAPWPPLTDPALAPATDG